jgi:hypothetical protein
MKNYVPSETLPLSDTLSFGKYKGTKISELLDDEYLCWLGKPVYSPKFYKSIHSTEKNFKVPFNVTIRAREELEKRGYELIGERWERRDP